MSCVYGSGRIYGAGVSMGRVCQLLAECVSGTDVKRVRVEYVLCLVSGIHWMCRKLTITKTNYPTSCFTEDA